MIVLFKDKTSRTVCRSHTTFCSNPSQLWNAGIVNRLCVPNHPSSHRLSLITLLHELSRTSVDRWDPHLFSVLHIYHRTGGRRQFRHCRPCTKPQWPVPKTCQMTQKTTTMTTTMIRIPLRLLPLPPLSCPSTGTSLHANASDWVDVCKLTTFYPGMIQRRQQVSPRKVDYRCFRGL